VKSTLPVRGRTVAMAAIAAVLLGLLLGAVDSKADTGGYSSAAPQPVVAPTARAALSTDNRTAMVPQGAPAPVVKAIAAANQITRKPYKWGGGHVRWNDTGYDCSGSVSYVLHAAGLLKTSRDSTGFTGYGYKGKGRWITIYANGGHAYMVIAGLRFDTSGSGEDGPRWRTEARSSSGFTVRHPPKL